MITGSSYSILGNGPT